MILYRVIVILSVVFFTAFSDDIKSVEVLKDECNKDHDVESCYEVGEYYEKQIDTNGSAIYTALDYYEKGCLHFYPKGIIFEDLMIKRNKKSCMKEAEIVKDNNVEKKKISSVVIYSLGNRLIKAGDSYYEVKDYKQAKDYYLKSLSFGEYGDTYYKLSQIELIGIDGKANYEQSKQYFINYIRHGIKIPRHASIKRRLFGQQGRITFGLVINSDGTVSNVKFINLTNNETINQLLIENIKQMKFYPIPKEYNMEKIDLPEIDYKF